MAHENRIGGVFQLLVNGVQRDAKGSFTINTGTRKRTAVMGANGETQGYKEEGQTAMVEGKLTFKGSLKASDITDAENATVNILLANGQKFLGESGWYAGDGNVSTDESEMDFKMEFMRGRYI